MYVDILTQIFFLSGLGWHLTGLSEESPKKSLEVYRQAGAISGPHTSADEILSQRQDLG